MAKKGNSGKGNRPKPDNNSNSASDSTEPKIIVVGANGEGSVCALPKGCKPGKCSHSPKKGRSYPCVALEQMKKMHRMLLWNNNLSDDCKWTAMILYI